MDDIAARAKKLGVCDPFNYLSYAAPWQDVIPSYDAESVKKLQQLQKMVGPGQVFSKKVAGGFGISSDS